MLKNLTFVLLLFLSFSNGLAQVSLDWADHSNLTGVSAGNIFDVDSNGNTYIAVIAGGTSRLIKYDHFGNVIWIEIASGYTITSISMDNTNSFLLIGGKTSSGADPIINKFDLNGNLIWSKSMIGTGSSSLNKLHVGQSGNIFITGSFAGTLDFDPNAGISNLVSTSGSSDIFLAKYDANGNYLWAFKLDGADSDVGYDVVSDSDDNAYISGYFNSTVDFDPGPGTVNRTSTFLYDGFLAKYDQNGNYVWDDPFLTQYYCKITALAIFDDYIYITGDHTSYMDIDPSSAVYYVSTSGNSDILLAKYRTVDGSFVWGTYFGSSNYDRAGGITCDENGNVIMRAKFELTVDFDPSANSTVLDGSQGTSVIAKYDSLGNLIYAFNSMDNTTSTAIKSIVVQNRKIYSSGIFSGTSYDFDPSANTAILTPNPGNNLAVLRYSESGVYGTIFDDWNNDCNKDQGEFGIHGVMGIIQPANYVVESNEHGIWSVDSLPAGNYTLTIDTTNLNWLPNCSPTQSFTVVDPDSVTIVNEIGMYSINPCPNPSVSIVMPRSRRCFTEPIYVQICNSTDATGSLVDPYTIIQLDSNLIVQNAGLPYTDLGNNYYRFDHDTLRRGECVTFTITVLVSCNTVLSQSVCMEATLYPVSSCQLDTLPGTQNGTVACTLPWDNSSLQVDATCQNDSIYFTVTNIGVLGVGDMQCFAPVRLYIDGQYILLDSVQLLGGQSQTFAFSGDGRTWRLEADQHPLHPGNSQPNATIEACGNIVNWNPNLVTILPQDDANLIDDDFCAIVSGSYDPNDKQGFPTGVGANHLILPNGQIEYLIRFQNTGTDTAYTVVIRDTLDTDLDIFSVTSGVSSHNYHFRIYGPRVLEWTFNNILLPDSTTNEAASHGFVTFSVNQNPGLPDSTLITNDADIYFDYNAPIITNMTVHQIDRGIASNDHIVQNVSLQSVCGPIQYRNLTYDVSGTYYQLVPGGQNQDTLEIIYVTIPPPINVNIQPSVCGTYTAPDNQVYTQSGTYVAILPSANGCDSTITIDLSISPVTHDTIFASSCDQYTSPSGSYSWTSSGIYHDTLVNQYSCDSIVTIDLIINPTSYSSQTITTCDSLVSPSGNSIWYNSGTYVDTLTNAVGCDSIVTFSLIVNSTSYSSQTLTACDSLVSPSGNSIWYNSGTYVDTLTNAVGCDSIVTFSLIVNSTSYSSQTITTCDSLVSPSGNAVWYNSGTYVDTLTNAVGCDSIVTFSLTVNPTSYSSQTITTCDSLVSPSGNAVWYNSGVYVDTLSNVNGCDSIVTINLTINQVVAVITVIDDTTLLTNGPAGSTYQWLNCSDYSIIEGATSSLFTVSQNGQYAVEVTANNCIDTSECITVSTVAVDTHPSLEQINVFPNPTTGIIHVSNPTNVQIQGWTLSDSKGVILQTGSTFGEHEELELMGDRGLYILTVVFQTGTELRFPIIRM